MIITSQYQFLRLVSLWLTKSVIFWSPEFRRGGFWVRDGEDPGRQSGAELSVRMEFGLSHVIEAALRWK